MNPVHRLTDGTLWIFGLSQFVGWFAALWFGTPYYQLTRDARLEHPLHDLLAPGAPLGVGFGILGTALMIAMLTYTLRRRVSWFSTWGRPAWWLRFHMICGVAGPAWIVLHGGWVTPRGLIASGFVCMLLAALSGVFGRYIYGLFPRMSNGRAMALDEAQDSLADARAAWVSATARADTAVIDDALGECRLEDAPPRGFIELIGRQYHRRCIRARLYRGLRRAKWGRDEVAAATRLFDNQVSLHNRLEATQVAERLVRYWHLFHDPLARAMYAIAALHIVTALLFGRSVQNLLHWLGVA